MSRLELPYCLSFISWNHGQVFSTCCGDWFSSEHSSSCGCFQPAAFDYWEAMCWRHPQVFIDSARETPFYTPDFHGFSWLYWVIQIYHCLVGLRVASKYVSIQMVNSPSFPENLNDSCGVPLEFCLRIVVACCDLASRRTSWCGRSE